MAGTQREFVLSRGAQLAILRDATFPRSVRTSRGGVSGILCKAVLTAIDHYGRGRESWPSIATLGQSAGGASDSQVRRALEALEGLSLICVARRSTGQGRQTSNHYRIVWSELALRSRGDQSVMAPDQSVMAPDQSVMAPDQSVMAPDQSVMGDHPRTALSALEPPPRTGAWEAAEDQLARVGVAEAAKAVRAARASGVEPDHVRELLEAWQAAAGAWGLGALKYRVAIARPGLGVLEGWPPRRSVAWGTRRDGQGHGQAVKIIRAGRRAGATDDAIRRQLVAAGLEWP